MSWQIIRADCVEAMKGMADGSVDSVVCDPPYGLEFMGKDWDSLNVHKQGHRHMQPDGSTAYQHDGRDNVGGRLSRTAAPPAPKKNPRCRRCGRLRFSGSQCDCQQPDWDTRTAEYGRDMQTWHQAWATEALRVLKPGGHLLAFGGTRTYHRLVCAVEDAGFEIRDTISWMYGSGFPKSLDVSKAIDKQAPRAAMFAPFAKHYAERRQLSGLNHREVCEAIGAHGAVNHGGASTNWEQGYGVPTVAQWATLAPLLRLSGEWLPLIERVEAEREKVGESAGVARPGFAGDTYGVGGGDRVIVDVTAPATPEAERWQGWGTALKPAHEPIVVARKPLSGTVASTVCEFGTGALNIDATRVGTTDSLGGGAEKAETIYDHNGDGWSRPWMHDDEALEAHAGRVRANVEKAESLGRWPANCVLSHSPSCVPVGTRKVKAQTGGSSGGGAGLYEPGLKHKENVNYADPDGTETIEAWSCSEDCPVRLLDEQTGELHSQDPRTRNSTSPRSGLIGFADGGLNYGDSGGASRFFYVAKASRAERNAGLEGFEEKEPPQKYGLTAGGNTSQQTPHLQEPRANHHPTVKPIELMRWLVRLVTPPAGTVLDPFAGSGTTGIAAVLEGFDFVGVEREPEYADIAEARIRWWEKHRGDGLAAKVLAAGSARDEVEQAGQLSLEEPAA